MKVNRLISPGAMGGFIVTVFAGAIVACSSNDEYIANHGNNPSPNILTTTSSDLDAADEQVKRKSELQHRQQAGAEQHRLAARSAERAMETEDQYSDIAELSSRKSMRDRMAQSARIVPLRVQSHEPLPQPWLESDSEQYQSLTDNGVTQASVQPTSTFSVDVDTGAYSNVRRFLSQGSLPPVDAVRLEELINYFSYDYKQSDKAEVPFSITTELGRTPWNGKTHLLHVGLQGYRLEHSERPPANLVFLLDVSGSMNHSNKLGLLKSSLNMLLKELDEKDTVSIVVYAGASGVVLEPTAGDKRRSIRRALSNLQAGGSTNGEAGIKLAYQLAEENFDPDGINRVILATDGDFNVGVSDIDALKTLVSRQRENGVALTTLGFGQGNYNDHLMEQLADTGNGAYAYIDTLNEARKVLVEELDSTLMTIAKDVKIQIEFNPAVVAEYRLIGYVNRHLENEDFNNDTVDAGEIGAGHSVTALYELALRGDGGELITPRRYGNSTTEPGEALNDSLSAELAELRLRFKAPGGDTSKLIKTIVKRGDVTEKPGENYRFSAAVAAFGQQLRQSKYLGGFDVSDTIELAQSARGTDEFGYRAEFIQLLNLAQSLLPEERMGSGESLEKEREG